MARTEIDLNPIDFITVGTIGPKGQRTFHLQAGQNDRLISFVIEKEQAWALSQAIAEFISDLDERYSETTNVEFASYDMDLREPIQPIFRIAQMGLAYEEDRRMVVLIAQELVPNDEQDPGIVRMWCTREQMLALSLQAMDIVKSGRPDPRMNGRITYYWT